MTETRERDERYRRHLPPAEKHRDGHDADAERQHPRLEVRFERIHARARDVVAQRDERAEGRRQPHGCIEPAAEQQHADPDGRHREQICRQEQRFERRARRSPDGAHDVVEDEELSLRANERRIMRKRGGILRQHDGRHVRRLIGHAVAIARAIRRREHDEHHETQQGEGGSGKGETVQKFGASSALGPYIAGTGTSFRRRYTLSWPRWWIT